MTYVPLSARKELEESFEDDDEFEDDDDDYLNLNEDEGKPVIRSDGPLILIIFCRGCLGRGVRIHGGAR